MVDNTPSLQLIRQLTQRCPHGNLIVHAGFGYIERGIPEILVAAEHNGQKTDRSETENNQHIHQ